MYNLEEARIRLGNDDSLVANELTERYPEINVRAGIDGGFSVDQIVGRINEREHPEVQIEQPQEEQFVIPGVQPVESQEPATLAEQYPDVNVQAALDAGYSEEDIRQRIEQRNQPSVSPQYLLDRGTTQEQPSADSGVLNIIAVGEGVTEELASQRGYDSPYDITLGYGAFADDKTKPITQMTISEIYDHMDLMRQHPDNRFPTSNGDERASSAVGRYQIIEPTLRGLVEELGLSEDTIFSREIQDQMGLALLNRRGYQEYLSGDISLEQFQSNMSREWASIADPATGKSHYGQHTGIGTAEFEEMISGTGEQTVAARPQERRQVRVTDEELFAMTEAEEAVREAQDQPIIRTLYRSFASGLSNTIGSHIRGGQFAFSEYEPYLLDGENPLRVYEDIESEIENQRMVGRRAEHYRNQQLSERMPNYQGGYQKLATEYRIAREFAAQHNDDARELSEAVHGWVSEQDQETLSLIASDDVVMDNIKDWDEVVNTWVANVIPNVPRMGFTFVTSKGGAPGNAIGVGVTINEMRGEFLSEIDRIEEITGIDLDDETVLEEANNYAIPAGAMEYIDNLSDISLVQDVTAAANLKNHIKNQAARTIARMAINGTIEGMTEVSQGELMSYVAGRVASQQGLTDQEVQAVVEASEQDQARAFIIGFGSGVILGGVGNITQTAQEQAQMDIDARVEQIQRIQNADPEAFTTGTMEFGEAEVDQADVMREIIFGRGDPAPEATIDEDVTVEPTQQTFEIVADDIAGQVQANLDMIEILRQQASVSRGANRDRYVANIEALEEANQELSEQFPQQEAEPEVAEEVTPEPTPQEAVTQEEEVVQLETPQTDAVKQTRELEFHRQHLENLRGRDISMQEAAEDWAGLSHPERESLAERYRERHIVGPTEVIRDNDRVLITASPTQFFKEFRETEKVPTTPQERAANEIAIAELIPNIAPKTESVNETTIQIERIQGQELGENITEQDVIDIANSVREMHDSGVVHNDLHMGIEDGAKTREGNIFRDNDGNIRLIDFEEAATQTDENFAEFVDDEVEIFADDQIPAEFKELFLQTYRKEEVSETAPEGSPREETREKEKVPPTTPIKERESKEEITPPKPLVSKSKREERRFSAEGVLELNDTQLSAQTTLAKKQGRQSDLKILQAEKARRGRQEAAGISRKGKGRVEQETAAQRPLSQRQAHIEARKEARAVAKERTDEISNIFEENVDTYIDDNNRYVELRDRKGELTDSEKVELRILERDLKVEEARQEQELAAVVDQNRERRKELKAQDTLSAEEEIELEQMNTDALALRELRKELPRKFRGERKMITEAIEEEKFSGMDENEFRLWLVDKMKVPPTTVKAMPTDAVKRIQDAVSRYSGMQGLRFRDNILKPLTKTLSEQLTGEEKGLAETTEGTRTVSLEGTGIIDFIGETDEQFQEIFGEDFESIDIDPFNDEENMDMYLDDGNMVHPYTTAKERTDKIVAPIAITRSEVFRQLYQETVERIRHNQTAYPKSGFYSMTDTEKNQSVTLYKLMRNALTNAADNVATKVDDLYNISILANNLRDGNIALPQLKQYAKTLYRFETMLEKAAPRTINTQDVIADIEISRQEGKVSDHEADSAIAVFEAIGVNPDVTFQMSTGSAYNFARQTIRVKQLGDLAHETYHWAYYNILSAKDRYEYKKKLYNKYGSEDGTTLLNTEMEKSIERSRANNNSEQYRELGIASNATYNPSEFFAEQGGEAIWSGRYRANDTLINKVRRFFKNLIDKLFGRTYTDSFMRQYMDIIATAGPELKAMQRKLRTREGLNGFDIFKEDIMNVADYDINGAEFIDDVMEVNLDSEEEMKVESEQDAAAETVETEEIAEEATETQEEKAKKKEQGEVSKRFSSAMRGVLMARDLQNLQDGNLDVGQAQALFIDYAVSFLNKGDLRKSLFRTIKNIKKVGDANWNHAAEVVGNIIETRNKSEEIVQIQKLYRNLSRRDLAPEAQRMFNKAVEGKSMTELTAKTEEKLDDAIRALTENKALVGITPVAERKLEEAKARLASNPIQKLGLAQLRELSADLALVLAEDRRIKKEIRAQKITESERRRQLAQESAENFQLSGFMRRVKTFEENVRNEKVRNTVIELRKRAQEVPLWDLNIEYMADLMGDSGRAIRELVIDPMVEAEQTANEWKYDSVDYFAQVIEDSKIDLKGWSSLEFGGLLFGGIKDRDVKRVTYNLESGRELSITYDEAANLLRVIRDEDGYRALIEAGLKRKQGRTQVDHWELTANDVMGILNTTPEDVRNYAYGVGDKYFNEYEAQKLNDLGQESLGRQIAVNTETYTHLNKDVDDVYTQDNQYASVQEILNRNAHSSRTPGSLKERLVGAGGAIVLEGMTEAVIRSAHEHGIYAGYYQTLGNVEAATKEITTELNKVGGEAVADKLSKKIASEMAASTDRYDIFGKKLQRLRSAYTVGKLGLRLGSAIVQNTSSLLYPVNVQDAGVRARLMANLPLVSAKSMAELTKAGFSVERAYSEMIENSPNMRARLEQGFAIDLTEKSSDADVKRFIWNMTGENRDAVSRLMKFVSPETAMGMIRMFDAKAMYEGWQLAKIQTELETGLTEQDGEKFWSEVRDRHNLFARKTQPTSSSFDRTGMQDASIIKSIAMFASFRSKLWQVIRQGVNELQTGNVRKGAETLATVVLLQLVSDMLKQGWKALRGGDVPEELEEWFGFEVANLLRSNIFFGDVVAGVIIPVLNDALGTEIKTYGDRSFITEVKEDIIKTAGHVLEGDWEAVRDEDLIKLSAAAQIPAEGFMEYVDALANIKEELE